MSKLENPEERPSLDPDQSQTKKCYICSKGFNFRKKHICKFCMNAVCTDHCQKARSVDMFEEAQPICDLCNMEEIKKELLTEIQNDIRSLEDELKASKSVNERMDREYFEKTAQINKLETELSELTETFKDQSETLLSEIEIEEKKKQGLIEKHQKLQEKVKICRNEEVEATQRFQKVNEECENLRRQTDILKETKDGLNSQLDKINAKLKGSLNVEHVNELLCEPCAGKLTESAKSRRIDAPSVLEDSNISVPDERESIMKSVREYKDILSQQNSRPNDSPGCLIN